MTVKTGFGHGGNVIAASRELGCPVSEILDFSASINPLGMPEEVLRAARESLAEAVHYPEIDGASLVEALSDYHRLPASHFLPGSGSTELIYLFPRVLRPRRALLVAPAFSEYERSLYRAGTIVDLFGLRAEENFRLDPSRLLKALHPEVDLVLLANPGNPTGSGIDAGTVEAIARGVREQALVAVDEAFVDFCPRLSVVDSVPFHSNLFVFRSLTKFYAIPGLRAGYLVGRQAAVARLAAAREPWTLSVPALAAARACLLQGAYRSRSLETIPLLRRELATGLEKLGLTVFPSDANFLLARLKGVGQTAGRLAALLRQKRILVRDCSDFASLDPRYLRVAVRGADDNARLLSAMEEALAAMKGILR